MISHTTYQYFLAALSHEIRTPLSVVSNEASYLSMTSPSPESEKILVKVRMISDMMRDWELPRQSGEELSAEQQEKVLHALCEVFPNTTFAGNANPFVNSGLVALSSAQWQLLLSTLIETFKPTSKVEFRSTENGFSLERLSSDREVGAPEEYESFSDLFIGRLGKCRVLYCWLDAMLSQQSLTARLMYRDDLCRIEIRCNR
jgi:hypothetical protein